MYWQSKKNLLNSNISSTSPQCGELRPTNGWHMLASLGHTSKFQRVSRVGFITALTSLNQTFAGCLTVSCSGTHIHFWGSCPITGFCQMQNTLCDQLLRSPILTALLHGTRALGISQTLRRGTRNGIIELLLLVIFNRGRHLYSKGGHHVHVGHRPTFYSKLLIYAEHLRHSLQN